MKSDFYAVRHCGVKIKANNDTVNPYIVYSCLRECDIFESFQKLSSDQYFVLQFPELTMYEIESIRKEKDL